MKLCKDCKYCEPTTSDILFFKIVSYTAAKCTHHLGEIDLVSGELNNYCYVSRKYSDNIKHCTPEGRYWEAK